jgi:catechol 2,3-dioxygenase-like lactoylglutathione lyase family enzyme
MTIERMEHVGIVVDDLAAATAFFVELGLKLQGEGPVEGRGVDPRGGARGRPRGDRSGGGTGRPRTARAEEVSRPVGPGRRPARADEHPGHPPYRIRSRRYRRRRRSLGARGAELVGEVERYEDSWDEGNARTYEALMDSPGNPS